MMSSPWKKILVFGKNGQLATALRSVLPASAVFKGHEEADFLNTTELLQTLQDEKPDLVINTSAYTQVDQAQTHVDACTKINATAVGQIANWCAGHGTFLVHISTDYVFDGRSSEPYKETSETNPLNIYGSSKLLAEHLIQKNGGRYLILRTSWLYHESGQNFIKAMLNYAREKDELRVVDDQISSPTYAGDFARALAKILEKSDLPSGLYHVANKGYCSRLELVNTALKIAFPFDSALKAKVSAAKTKDFLTPAQRPLVTKLDVSLAEMELGLALPPWQDGLTTCLRALYAKN
jgi:dTDP-4-dehydrorhamnose reductase